jgi:ketosteroid isomerase-like protein
MQAELNELLDKQAITEVIHRYAQAIDRRDTDLLASIFTSDAVLHYGAGLFEGPASVLVENWRIGRPSPFLMTHHQVGNILIRLQGGDRASAITYLTAVHRALRDGRILDEWVRARYLDRLVKRAGEWRFAERTLVYDWSHVAPADVTSWWEQPGASALIGAHGAADPGAKFST